MFLNGAGVKHSVRLRAEGICEQDNRMRGVAGSGPQLGERLIKDREILLGEPMIVTAEKVDQFNF